MAAPVGQLDRRCPRDSKAASSPRTAEADSSWTLVNFGWVLAPIISNHPDRLGERWSFIPSFRTTTELLCDALCAGLPRVRLVRKAVAARQSVVAGFQQDPAGRMPGAQWLSPFDFVVFSEFS